MKVASPLFRAGRRAMSGCTYRTVQDRSATEAAARFAGFGGLSIFPRRACRQTRGQRRLIPADQEPTNLEVH